jgi:hypothetical protein
MTPREVLDRYLGKSQTLRAAVYIRGELPLVEGLNFPPGYPVNGREQFERCLEAASKLGAALPDDDAEYVDHANGGLDDDRPSLVELLFDLVLNRHFDFVIVDRREVLADDPADAKRIERLIQQCGARLVVCDEIVTEAAYDLIGNVKV